MGTTAVLVGAALAASAAAGLRAVRRCGAARGGLALALPLAAFSAGAWLPAPPWVRAGVFVYAIAALSKSLALSRERCTALPLGRVAAYLLAWPGLHPDWAFARDPAAPRAAGRIAFAVGAAQVLAALAWAGAAEHLGLLDAGLYVPAWCRAASLVLLFDGAFRATAGALRAGGLHAEEAFRDPWRMEDLRSFWGRRWNRIVGRTLALEVFAPVRRAAGGAAGVLAAFLASGLVHEVSLHVPTGASRFAYLAFFGLHGAAIVLLDVVLPGPGRGAVGRTVRRLAAWAALLATAPLFFGAAYREAVPLEDLGRALVP